MVLLFVVVSLLGSAVPLKAQVQCEVTAMWDDFEFHACDLVLDVVNMPSDPDDGYFDPLEGFYRQWRIINFEGNHPPAIDCTLGYESAQSVKVTHELNIFSDEPMGRLEARPIYPFYMPKLDWTMIFEQDVYLPLVDPNAVADPNNPAATEYPAAEQWIIGGGSEPPLPAAWHALAAPGSKWEYGTGSSASLNWLPSDVDVTTGWTHVRVEVNPDWTYSMWVTPDGGTKTPVVLNAPSPTPHFYGDFFRSYYWAKGGVVNWDNMRVAYIDHHVQGFPVITKAPAGITIDGVIDLNNEWKGVQNVAAKPGGSDGVFESSWLTAIGSGNTYDPLIDPNKIINVYAAYDDGAIYVAARLNKALFGQAETSENAAFEAVISFDNEVWSDDVSYVYGCQAVHASAADDGDLYSIKYNDSGRYIPGFGVISKSCKVDPAFDYNEEVIAAGGLIDYSITNGIMDVEMKIPLTLMPDANSPPIPGTKLVLQFNAEAIIGGWTPTDPWAASTITTNLNTEVIPWFDAWVDIGIPLVAGITFSDQGDFNGDGRIDLFDFAMLGQVWMESSITINLTGDITIDMNDLGVLFSNWLNVTVIDWPQYCVITE